RYPASMTAVVMLPDNLQATASDGDQLAAFINDECRGVGEKVKVNAKDLYFVLIRGLAEEQSKIVFKYYNSKTAYLYQTGPELNFLIDAIYGTAENPQLLQLKPVK
ncbi:MAG: hypothetical protein ACJ749_20330, partial [Flavisolibacter sp.]